MLSHAGALVDIEELLEGASLDVPLGVLVVRAERVRETELSLGYAAGAAFRQAMQHALEAAMRPGDRVRRIGESAFLVLLPTLRSGAHAGLAASKIIRALQRPFDVGGAQAQPSVLVGIAIAPQDGADPEQLCLRADCACEDAADSVERHAFWKTPPVPLGTLHNDLRAAIADNQLMLHLQPIATLPDRTIQSYEALSRWTHPRLGNISPDVFIQVAERGGLIGDLTRWSLNVALRHLATMRSGGQDIRIAVNLSVDVLQAPGFVDQVLDLLLLWRVPGNALVFEITESALMRDIARCTYRLSQLRDAGIHVEIDDFGTGYSSLAYLRWLPIDGIKIDRSFVNDMARDRRARRIVETMIDLAHDLDLSVVAEGIEDEETLALLGAARCDFVQGYLIARPAPADEVVAACMEPGGSRAG